MMHRHERRTVARRCVVVAIAMALAACATRPADNASGDAGNVAAPPAAGAGGAGSNLASAPPTRAPGSGDTTAGGTASARNAPRDNSVYFEYDSSTLSEPGQRVVQQHAEYLAGGRRPIRLEGNADERGSREYNISLGQRRADAVRQMLVLRGMSGDAVESVSLGEERPRCTDQTESCFASNRRVDFVYR